MDGSKRTNVISTGIAWPSGLAIDYTVNRLYWADAKMHKIESANLDGSKRLKIVEFGKNLNRYLLTHNMLLE